MGASRRWLPSSATLRARIGGTRKIFKTSMLRNGVVFVGSGRSIRFTTTAPTERGTRQCLRSASETVTFDSTANFECIHWSFVCIRFFIIVCFEINCELISNQLDYKMCLSSHNVCVSAVGEQENGGVICSMQTLSIFIHTNTLLCHLHHRRLGFHSFRLRIIINWGLRGDIINPPSIIATVEIVLPSEIEFLSRI